MTTSALTESNQSERNLSSINEPPQNSAHIQEEEDDFMVSLARGYDQLNDTSNLPTVLPIKTLVNTLPLSESGGFIAPYVPCPKELVQAALDWAQLSPLDTLVDLGCGDGRLCTAALEREPSTRPNRVIGVELDPHLIQHIRTEHSKLLSQLNSPFLLIHDDMFAQDLESLGATVLVLYLLPAGLGLLSPCLKQWLSSDATQHVHRIVTIDYPIPNWTPSNQKSLLINGYPKTLYFYSEFIQQ